MLGMAYPGAVILVSGDYGKNRLALNTLSYHQGRSSTHYLTCDQAQHAPGNMYFTTTRFHQEKRAIFVDVIKDAQ